MGGGSSVAQNASKKNSPENVHYDPNIYLDKSIKDVNESSSSGGGIPKVYHDRILEKLTQSESSTWNTLLNTLVSENISGMDPHEKIQSLSIACETCISRLPSSVKARKSAITAISGALKFALDAPLMCGLEQIRSNISGNKSENWQEVGMTDISRRLVKSLDGAQSVNTRCSLLYAIAVVHRLVSKIKELSLPDEVCVCV